MKHYCIVCEIVEVENKGDTCPNCQREFTPSGLWLRLKEKTDRNKKRDNANTHYSYEHPQEH